MSMLPKQKLDAIDKGLLALVVLLDDPLLGPDRIPHDRHKAILKEAVHRLSEKNIYFRMLMALRKEILKEAFDDAG